MLGCSLVIASAITHRSSTLTFVKPFISGRKSHVEFSPHFHCRPVACQVCRPLKKATHNMIRAKNVWLSGRTTAAAAAVNKVMPFFYSKDVWTWTGFLWIRVQFDGPFHQVQVAGGRWRFIGKPGTCEGGEGLVAKPLCPSVFKPRPISALFLCSPSKYLEARGPWPHPSTRSCGKHMCRSKLVKRGRK